MSTCAKRKELLENSETWWGQMRWKAHVRSCLACAELARVEQEMTSLLQGLGRWEEPPGLAERVGHRLSGAAPAPGLLPLAPAEPSRSAFPPQRKARRFRWAAGIAIALCVVVSSVLLWGPHSSDIAFADVMERLSQQAAFRTSGTILEGAQGMIRYRQFEQIAEREEGSVSEGKVHWNVLWRLWESASLIPSERRSQIELPSNLDFPSVLWVETKRDEQGNMVRSCLFPADWIYRGSRYQFMFTGLPWMSRLAAESAIRHPAAEFKESQEKVADKTVKTFSLAIRDTQGNQVMWKFYVSYQTRLPYRVQATYRSKAGLLRQADYVVDYPSVRP